MDDLFESVVAARCGSMLQRDEPDDYVVATGESHSVRDLVECAFEHLVRRRRRRSVAGFRRPRQV